jgi:hypothetical protein
MNKYIETLHEMPKFDMISRRENQVTTNSGELDLMIIDIGIRQRKTNKNEFKQTENNYKDDVNFQLANELRIMNKEPILMKSLFLPDTEDVYFNNLDIQGRESYELITDEEIMKRQPIDNKHRGKSSFGFSIISSQVPELWNYVVWIKRYWEHFYDPH